MSLTSYKNFLQGIGVIPKSVSENSKLGELETLNTTNKLYFHNGTVNDPIVQENVASTLTNKTLTAPIINNSTADTITGIAGGPLLIQSASGQNATLQSLGTGDLNLLAAGTGKVFLESLTIDGSNISASTDIVVNQTGSSKTFFQVLGANTVRIDADGIAFLNQKDAKFYDGTNVNYVNIEASASTATYPITLPASAPTANTALVYDGTQYKWGAAGGADSAGANDDILATAFRARILDSFDDAPALSSSTIDSTTTTATHVPANQLYSIQYINTTISGANTTTPTVTPVGGYTIQVGDAIVLGSEVRFVSSITPLTIPTAFSTASGSCIVSKTVSTKELYNSTFDGDSIADAFNASSFSEYLIDYQDSTSAIYQANVAPKVSFSVSQNGTSWANWSSRPTLQTDQIQSGTFATPGTNLYVRLFANNVAGSGTINLLEYRAYMQKSPTVSSGVLNTAYARLDGSTTPQNCSLSVVGGKTRVTLTWPYSNGVNNPSAYGSIDVYVNGQFIPRQVGSYLTTGAFYTEISNTVIELDTNYSTTPYAVQIVQRQPMGNFTSSSGGSSTSTGSGLKNYLTTYNNNPGNGNFETGDTTGWSLFNTTLTSLIPTGSINTGATSISTFAATATSPLAGTYSLLVGGASGITAGQGFISNAFTIDREDRAKVLSFNFAYEVISGTAMNFSGTSANTWAIYLHDGTNWIQPAGVYGMVQSSGTGYVTGTFQTGATATQYRLAVICINAVGSAVSMEFDDFFVGPQISVNAPAMSDWVSFTPTVSVSSGTITNFTSSGFWRRNGSNVEVRGKIIFSSTSSAFSGLLASIPSGLTIDTSKLTSGTQNLFGSVTAVDQGIANYVSGNVFYNAPTLVALLPAGINSFTGTAPVFSPGFTNTFPFTFNTNDEISWEFSAPITGWSSNTVASADTDTRVVAAAYQGLSSTTVTSGTALRFTTQNTDTHAAYNTSTGAYIVPVSGVYEATVSGIYSTASSDIRLFKNGVNTQVGPGGFMAINTSRAGGTIQISCNAGDSLTFIPNSSITTVDTNGNLTIKRLSGPAVVQASESVNANYYTTSTGSMAVGTPATVIMGTRSFDSHNAYNTTTGVYTVPVSGKYQVNATICSASTAQIQTLVLDIMKNGSTWNRFQASRLAAVSSAISTINSAIVSVNAGDTIEIRCAMTSGTGNFNGNAYENNFTIARIGN